MNQLTGRLVVIVLSIREGRGFSPIQNYFYVEGTLNGRKILSDPIIGSTNPMFCTELVWEIEKKEIRKLRSSHTPLRIECFMMNELDQREKIGFVLLHLRSAKPVTSEQIADLDYKWNKLLGVHTDHKATHPELALSLTIRDKLRDIQTTGTPRSATEETYYREHLEPYEQIENMPQSVSIVYLKDGFIQIGDGENSKEIFTLSFYIEVAFNLDLLLPKKHPLKKNETEYYLALTFFDVTMNTKKFYDDLHEPVVLNDKIMFQLHSNSEFLRTFFAQYRSVVVNFCHGTDVLGCAEIELKNLNITQFFSEKGSIRTKFEQDCLFKSVATYKVPEDKNGRKPFTTTQTALERNCTETYYDEDKCPTNNSELEIKDSSVEYFDTIKDTQACGDQNYSQELLLLEKITSTSEVSVQTSNRESRVTRSAFTNVSQITTVKNNSFEDLVYDEENYHLYALTVYFKSIIWKRLNCEGFQFRFRHPKANTILIVQCNSEQIVSQEPVTLENVKCIQYFVSTPKNITTLVYNYPSKVTICTEECCNLSEEFELYTKLFLSQKNKMANGMDTCTCSYGAMISDESNEDDIVCEIQVEMCLADYGVNPDAYEKSCYDLEPLILDERLAFKTLQDLETWKKNQQLMFDERQKYMEAEKLKILNDDWDRKRRELEAKLQTGIEKCRILSDELIFATQELDNKRKSIDVQKRYIDNPELIELQVTQMMETEMNIKIEQIRKDNLKLLEQIQMLQFEKQKLTDEITKKDLDFDELKRSTLTEEQTKSLLQEVRLLEEKYRLEQNAKEFFKEQWQKAVKEVHILKSEDQKQIQLQILKQKNELSHLSLEDYEKDTDSSGGSSRSVMSCPSEERHSCTC